MWLQYRRLCVRSRSAGEPRRRSRDQEIEGRMNQNFYARLHEVALRRPDAECLIFPDSGSWTYGQLEQLCARYASVLWQSGARPGDRVVVQVSKSPEAVALYLACLRTGVIHVPLNDAYTAAELAYFLADAEPAIVCCDPARAETIALSTTAELLTLGSPDGRPIGSLVDRAARATPMEDVTHRREDDVAAIVYTSGTTGRSKGAMLTHRNLASNATTLCTCWGWREEDVLIHALPLFHVHGLFVALHCAMLFGSAMIFLPTFDRAAIMAALPRATVLMGVPTFYTRLLQHDELNRDTLRQVRLFISGSAPLTVQTFESFESRTGHRILERYGMSETLMITSNPLDGERVPGTVGFALPGVECRVCGEDGATLPAGTIGGIEVRGPNVFCGYWRQPEKTRAELREDGFFRTGDLGQMGEDGRLTIVGRSKDVVIAGGYNIYPKEIELLIDEIPGVSESAVFGLPHPDLGEAVVAMVVPAAHAALDESVVIEALAQRLARFKQPRRVLLVDALPRNSMGKVQKNELRARYATLFA
jgi:malonyl-CoA/methylmalonyl-CoA synthetase